MASLAGKVAIVTGAAQGIGRAFTEILMKRGAQVCMVDINNTLGNQAKSDLAAEFGKGQVDFRKCDVTSLKELEDVFDHTKSTFGGIDIVCNNAGVMDESKYPNMLYLNLGAVIDGTFLGLKHMDKENGGRGGVIVNTASAVGLIPFPCGPRYAATKFGVVGFTHSMGFYHKRKTNGVRVNCICPSVVDTDLIKYTEGMMTSEKQYKKIISLNPPLAPKRIAEGMMRLVEDESLNGAALVVDAEGQKLMKLPSTVDDIPLASL